MVYDRTVNIEVVEVLQYFYKKGLIAYLIHGINDSTVRGSDNHKNGIVRLLPHVETEKVVLLDNDAWPVRHGWVDFLLRESANVDLYGVKQKRRGYVHPSCMIIDTAFIKNNQEQFKKGDCAEGLSSVPGVKKSFMDVIDYNVSSKEDDCLGSIYGIEFEGFKHGYVYHMWGASRYEAGGVDYFSREDVDRNIRLTRDLYYPEVVVIIPTWGEIDEGVDIWKTMNTTRKRLCFDCIDGCIFPGERYESTSKAEIMNYAFLETPAEYVIFQDRDILGNEEWCRAVEENIHAGEKVFLNQNGVYYEGKLEPNPPGGSLTVEWLTFFDVGGFDNNMSGVGLEDREFLLRCEKVLGKPVKRLDVQLVHQDHPRKLKYGDYKNSIRDQVWNKTLSMEGRRDYIWDSLKVIHTQQKPTCDDGQYAHNKKVKECLMKTNP
jgi:hypothetical protein